MKAHHSIGSIFWLIIGVYTAINAYRLGIGIFRRPGPGFIFFLAGLLLIILSIIDLMVTLYGKSKKSKEDEPIWSSVRWQKVLIVLVGMSIYTYIFSYVGFFLCTFLLMIFLFKVVESTKWWAAVLGSFVTNLISYAIFKLWLGIPFPQGVLGF